MFSSQKAPGGQGFVAGHDHEQHRSTKKKSARCVGVQQVADKAICCCTCLKFHPTRHPHSAKVDEAGLQKPGEAGEATEPRLEEGWAGVQSEIRDHSKRP